MSKKVYPEQGRRVFVGLSGGVDSAVSAALLKQAGYDVTGVFIKVWQADFLPCTWRDERRDAMRVAIALDIPFVFLDLEDEYKKGVVDKIVSEYKAGRTPNPDVLCNREVKFGAFWQRAKEMGADYIATGHYVQNTVVSSKQCVVRKDEGSALLPTTSYLLQTGLDINKDQSYFLWTLTQEDLSHTLFPVGGLEKDDVRKLAKKFKLPVAEKKDSQGICFIGEVSMDEFLSHFLKSKSGDILDVEGRVIGRHKGALYYTIGERKGLDIHKKGANDKPYFVISKDMKANTVTVSNKAREIVSAAPKRVLLSNVNWIKEPTEARLEARIRHRGERVPVKLGVGDEGLYVEFIKKEKGVSMGQSIVFYEGETCLGGGVMGRALL